MTFCVAIGGIAGVFLRSSRCQPRMGHDDRTRSGAFEAEPVRAVRMRWRSATDAGAARAWRSHALRASSITMPVRTRQETCCNNNALAVQLLYCAIDCL